MLFYGYVDISVSSHRDQFILKDGLTPVVLALRVENRDLVTLLIENGADINTPSVDVRKSSIVIMTSFLMSFFCFRYIIYFVFLSR